MKLRTYSTRGVMAHFTHWKRRTVRAMMRECQNFEIREEQRFAVIGQATER